LTLAAEDIHRRDAEDAEFPQRELTEKIIGAAIEVHRSLGPGLLESVYQRALQHELALRDVEFRAQISVALRYKGASLEPPLRLDLLVAGKVIVEVKSVTVLEEIHRAQLLTYLRLADVEIGLIINFNVPVLRQGIKRVINPPRPSAFSAPLR
jgi:GxxExxY protein